MQPGHAASDPHVVRWRWSGVKTWNPWAGGCWSDVKPLGATVQELLVATVCKANRSRLVDLVIENRKNYTTNAPCVVLLCSDAVKLLIDLVGVPEPASTAWGGGPLVWSLAMGPMPDFGDGALFVAAHPGLEVTGGPDGPKRNLGRVGVIAPGDVYRQQGDDVVIWTDTLDSEGRLAITTSGYSTKACGKNGKFELALPYAGELVLTVHAMHDDVGVDGRTPVSCTSMSGEELAAVAVDLAAPLREMRDAVVSELPTSAYRLVLILPDGRTLEEAEMDRPAGDLLEASAADCSGQADDNLL